MQIQAAAGAKDAEATFNTTPSSHTASTLANSPPGEAGAGWGKWSANPSGDQENLLTCPRWWRDRRMAAGQEEILPRAGDPWSLANSILEEGMRSSGADGCEECHTIQGEADTQSQLRRPRTVTRGGPDHVPSVASKGTFQQSPRAVPKPTPIYGKAN